MAGQFTAGPFYVDSITDGRKDYDVSSEIGECRKDMSKWMSLMMKARKKPTKTTICKWNDQAPLNYWTQINNESGYNTSAVTFIVDDGTIFAQFDLIKIPRTGEVMRVQSATATTVTVAARAFGGSAAALQDNDYIIMLGNAMSENSNAPASKLVEPTEFYNVTQIFRTPFDASASDEAEEVKTTPKERIRLRLIKQWEHKMLINYAFWHGVRVNDTTNHVRAAGGIIPRLQTNTWNVNGPLAKTELNAFLRDVFTYGSGSKVLIGSPIIAGGITNIADSKLIPSESAKKFGLNINTWVTAFGELDIIMDNTFGQFYAGAGVILDIQDVFYRPLQGRDTKFKQDIQANDTDGWKDEYLTEATFQIRNEPDHGFMYGVTG